MHDQPVAKRRMTSPERRDALLLAARSEFARNGFHGASTSRIAASAGCSEPMLYKHFATKQALFAATLEHVSALLEAGFEAVLAAPGDVLETWIGSIAIGMHNPAYGEMMALRTLAVSMVDDDQVLKILSGINERHVARFERALSIARDSGIHLRPEFDAEYVAWMWMGIMQAASFRSAIEPGGFAASLPIALRFVEDLRA